MNKKPKTLWMALTLVACGGVDGSTSSPQPVAQGPDRVLSSAELTALPADKSLTIDLREARAILVDAAKEHLDFSRIMLICPNGQRMSMDAWLEHPSAALNIPLHTTHFGIFPPGTTDPLCEPNSGLLSCTCNQRCYQCSDGAWVCYDPCVHVGVERLPWRPTDPTLGRDLPGEPPPSDPLPPTPPDPVGAGGSSGGSSGGSGGSAGGGGGSSGGGGGGGSSGGSGGSSGSSSSGSGSGHTGGGTPAGGGLGGGL